MEILIPRPLCGDNTTIAMGFSPAEVAALEAAGRAAGFADLRSTILATVGDAIDVGFRALRANEHASANREAHVIQAA